MRRFGAAKALSVVVSVLALAALALAAAPTRLQAQADQSRPAFAEPSPSPDGKEIAFVSGGDIWTVPAEGGVARLLVTDDANESRPVYSPDGRFLAFQSNRNGPANIYILALATGEVRRLTWSDGAEELNGWSADSRWIYFSANSTDLLRQPDIFRVAAGGGTPLEVSRERLLSEFHAAPSPDGSTIALTARGNSHVQWWRNGHSNLDVSELWLKPLAQDGAYRKLLANGSKHAWPMWARDGASLYFMSDVSGTENLWRLSTAANARPEQLTRFTSGRLLFPQMSGAGQAIVFERNFGVWRYDLRTGQAAEVPISLRGAPAGMAERRLNETSFRDLALSPDGKKVAVIAHGEVFAASAKDGGTAQRISNSAAGESQVGWSPDSNRIVYVSERGLNEFVVEHNVALGKETVLTSRPGFDETPTYSPDGKMIAYVHDDKELRVMRLDANGRVTKDDLLFSGALDSGDGTPPSWSPDSRWIAFVVTDARSFTNIHVVDAIAGGTARPISFLANGQTTGTISWAPDGRYILFSTAQRSEEARIVRVDLQKRVPKYREDAFRDLFKQTDQPDRSPAPPASAPKTPPSEPQGPAAQEKQDDDEPRVAPAATPPAPKAGAARRPEPVNIVFDGIRERASILPLGLNVREPVISPDGKTLVFRATVGGVANYYSYNLDELAREAPTPQPLTSTRVPKSNLHFSPDSREVFYLAAGVVTASPVETPRPRAVAITGELDVDFAAEKVVVFNQAWSLLNRLFYDPQFKGRDWGRLRQQWLPYVQGARTPDELRRIMNLLIGELNASHMGMGRPAEGFGSAPAPRTADLGLRFDREAYERGRGLVIREVIALGPADIEGTIKPGETLVSVNGTALAAGVSLDRLMQNLSGRRTVLRIGAAGNPAQTREAVVRPIAAAAAQGLLYRQWIAERRAYVEKASNGRLGYVHIQDMTEGSLNQLYLDLDAANQEREGVIIDIRNNNGGFVNGYVLDVFARRNYITMHDRDRFPVPARQNLGQRALGAPTILVTNEASLSDAEDFTEGYRSLGLGKVVGQPTSGWIIFTFNATLIDGSTVRLPFSRIRDLKGQDMEMNPRPVDLRVERPLGETLAGKDAQLDAAVAELLKSLPPRR